MIPLEPRSNEPSIVEINSASGRQAEEDVFKISGVKPDTKLSYTRYKTEMLH